MSSTAVPKSRYLQSLSNIDLAHRNKKVITTPTRPPPASRVSKDASVVVPKAQPVIVDTTSVQPVRVRKIYERDFLLKFKYACTEFPPGVTTPAELVEQYNKDLEIRESRERQAMLESSSLSARNSYKPAVVEKPSAPAVSVSRAPSASGAEKEVAKEKKAASTGLKLRMPSTKNSNLSRLPMFSPKAAALQPPVQHVPSALDNKENKASTWSNVIAPAVAAVKKQKVPAPIPPTTVPSVSPIIIDSVQKPMTPAVVVELKPEPVLIIAPEPATLEKPIEDLEELSKKLKSVLREEDPRRLAQRQKQIDYGKNTQGYSNYTTSVAKSKRKREDPKTPNKNQICSKRSWDGQIRKWRRQLHFYDPKGVEFSEDAEMSTADDIEDDVDVTVQEIDTPVPIAIETSVC